MAETNRGPHFVNGIGPNWSAVALDFVHQAAAAIANGQGEAASAGTLWVMAHAQRARQNPDRPREYTIYIDNCEYPVLIVWDRACRVCARWA
jgi:hypothetical protein